MCKSFSPRNLSWDFYQVQANRLVFQFLKGKNYFISNKKLKVYPYHFQMNSWKSPLGEQKNFSTASARDMKLDSLSREFIELISWYNQDF